MNLPPAAARLRASRIATQGGFMGGPPPGTVLCCTFRSEVWWNGVWWSGVECSRGEYGGVECTVPYYSRLYSLHSSPLFCTTLL